MDKITHLHNYALYLKFVQNKLDKLFEKQKEYLCCNKGCGKCCKSGQFHYSEIEFMYLLTGYMQLDKETQQIIDSRINKILEHKKNFNGKTFKYDCPFLINEACSVYEHRGVICRSFGLMIQDPSGKINVPFCAYEGLSYSKVLDTKTNEISEEKVQQEGYKERPLGFNAGYNYLTSEEYSKSFNVEFKNKKPMIEWYENNQ